MLIIVTLASAISIGVVNCMDKNSLARYHLRSFTVFVFHRIYAIWGYNKRILRFVIPPFVCVYGTAVALSIYSESHPDCNCYYVILDYESYISLLHSYVKDIERFLASKPPLDHTGYLSSPFKECALETRPTSLVVTWTLLVCCSSHQLLSVCVFFWLQVVLDIYLAILAIWNAFERPRETNTVLVRQLFNDGLGYFMVRLSTSGSISLRSLVQF